jgi:hypothetical protein
MSTQYYAKATIGGDDTVDQGEIIVVETHWSQDDGWQEGDIVDSAEWLFTFDDEEGAIAFEPIDIALERMGWQKLHKQYWTVDAGWNYVTRVKPLPPGDVYIQHRTPVEPRKEAT